MMHFCENRSTIMVISFFLFWRPGCSAARNSPACKDKNLRCLRKCRFAYIDTSPALSARRHLTAACFIQRALHTGLLACIWAVKLIRHGALPDISKPRRVNWSPAQRAQFKTFRMDYSCNRRRMARPRQAPGTACEAVRCSRAGCEAEGRLCCEFEVKRQKTSTSSVSVREPPSPAQAGLVLDHSSCDEAGLNGRTFTHVVYSRQRKLGRRKTRLNVRYPTHCYPNRW